LDRNKRRHRLIVGVACAGFSCAFAWLGAGEFGSGNVTGGLTALAATLFMLVGAVGGLFGPGTLPAWSIQDLLFAPISGRLGRVPTRKV
jgi:hypothetical protein